MTYLLLAVGCSLAIGMIFKHAGRRGLNRMALLTTNYAAAALTALVLIALGEKSTTGGLALDPWLVVLGMGTGALFIGGFFLLALATEEAGMSVATGVMRISVMIPVVASWGLWGEVPTPAQGLGLACAGAAFFMIARREREGEKGKGEEGAGMERVTSSGDGALAGAEGAARGSVAVAAPPAAAAPKSEAGGSRKRVFGVLLLLFVAGGLVDTCMKAFDEVFAAGNSRALFLLMAFGVAFLSGAGWLLAKRRPPGRAVLAWGALLGLVNYGSVEFILRALRTLRGPFVFPANNVSIVVGAALLGLWFWGERLSPLNKAGLAMAGLALFLLRP